MTIKKKNWYLTSRLFEAATIFMGAVLIVDAWILGDAGPDYVWYLNACIAGLTLGLGIFAENKAGITYEEADDSSEYDEEDEDEGTAPAFLKLMR